MTDEAFIEMRYELQPDREVVVRFFKPEPETAGWRCDGRIGWPDREQRLQARGEDAVQALVLALERAHVDLLASPEGRAGKLTLYGTPDLGLPLPAGREPEDFA